MRASTDPETRSAPETGSPPETGSAPGFTPAPRTGRPWRTALAGLLLLGTAGGMMAYGAPSHAAVPAPSQPAHAGALVSATLLQHVSAKSVRAELAGARLAPGAPQRSVAAKSATAWTPTAPPTAPWTRTAGR